MNVAKLLILTLLIEEMSVIISLSLPLFEHFRKAAHAYVINKAFNVIAKTFNGERKM